MIFSFLTAIETGYAGEKALTGPNSSYRYCVLCSSSLIGNDKDGARRFGDVILKLFVKETLTFAEG